MGTQADVGSQIDFIEESICVHDTSQELGVKE